MTVFNALSDDYDSYRPPYPEALYAWLTDRLGLARSSRIADIACGTGKSTMPWCAVSDHITGLELASGMLFHARRRAAEAGCRVSWIQARAESSGMFSASQDLVTVAQAFHWLGPEAVDEFARVLRPGGALAIYWNIPDTEAPHARALLRLIQAFNPDYEPIYDTFDRTAERLAAHGAFDPVETRDFHHVVRYSLEEYLGYQASRSFVGGTIRGAAWERFAERLKVVLREHFPSGVVEEGYRVAVTLGIKRA